MKEAARVANYAGGIVVMKSGTATVTIEEIKNAIESETLALITNTYHE